jgi:hypothetical protein
VSALPGPGRQQARPVRLDIRQVTLDGYTAGQRQQFARALRARLTGHGAPAAAAQQAAEAILDAVDARLEDRDA